VVRSRFIADSREGILRQGAEFSAPRRPAWSERSHRCRDRAGAHGRIEGRRSQTRSRFINPLATWFRIWPAPGPSTRNPNSHPGRVPIELQHSQPSQSATILWARPQGTPWDRITAGRSQRAQPPGSVCAARVSPSQSIVMRITIERQPLEQIEAGALIVLVFERPEGSTLRRRRSCRCRRGGRKSLE